MDCSRYGNIRKRKNYIDTALISLIPITIADGAKAAASGGEFVQLVVHEAERQLKGRVFYFRHLPIL